MRQSTQNLFFLVLVGFFTLMISCGGGGSDDDSEASSSDAFFSELTVTPDGAFVAEGTEITAKVSVVRDDDNDVANVALITVDENGDETAELADMLDNGNTSNGDDIIGDYVYAALVTVDDDEVGTIRLKAKVTYADDSTAKTDVKEVAVMERLTSAQWETVINTPATVNTYLVANGPTATATYLNAGNVSGIVAAGVSGSRDAVWFVYDTGIVGGVIFNATESPTATALSSSDTEPPSADETVTSGVLRERGGRPMNESVQGNANAQSPVLFPSTTSKKSRFLSTTVTIDENAPTSKQALLLSPYYHQFRGNDDFWGAWQPIKNSVCPKFDLTKKFNMTQASQNITPEDFKNLDKYGVVVLSTHGDNWYNGLFSLWEDLFGTDTQDPTKALWLADDNSVVIMLTGYLLTAANRATYESDLRQHRLVVAVDGSLAITPSFISAYTATMPNSVVWLGSCRSAYNSSMADAFTAKGANFVVGFSDYVNSAYCRDVGKNLFGGDVGDTAATTDDGMLDLSPSATTAGTAFATAVSNWGATDDSTDPGPAAFTKYGDSAATLNMSAIDNGGFEEGSAIGWTSSGDFRVLAYLGDVDAQEGTYMGVISTGLGATTVESGEGSTFEQTMCVPAGVTTASFKYDVITEEAMCYVGSAYDDTFQVKLINATTAVEVAESPGVLETVNSSSWTFLGGDYFYGGDDYSNPETCEDEEGNTVYHDGTYHTGWQDGSVDIEAYAGLSTPVTLKFNVYDQGDSAWDSAVTIDDVALE